MRSGPWLAAVLAAMLSAQGAQPARFALAIVRLDGRLVPFAAYDAGRWEQAWPHADEPAKATPTIEEIPGIWRKRGEPVPTKWRVWPASGAPSVDARVTGVVVVESHCQAQVALATDLPPAKGEHRQKLGMAADANLSVVPVEAVSRAEVLWNTAERIVVANFDALEAAKALADRSPVAHESPAPQPRLTHLYKETKAPRSPMYFVAEKKYRTARHPQDRECGAATVVTGWLTTAEDGTVLLRDADVFLTDCDEKVVRRGLPLGAFRASEQLFWVMQEHGYEDETYRIAEIGATDVRYPITFPGGGC